MPSPAIPRPCPARQPRAAADAALALMPLIAPATGLSPLGIFDHHRDVAEPRLAGSAIFDRAEQTYTLSGAGVNIWSAFDQFHFAWKRIRSDFMIQATVRFIGEGVNPHRKIGIIARDDLTTDSRYADARVHGDTLTSLQYRPADGALTDQVVIHAYHPTEIQCSRRGNFFTFHAATLGESYKAVPHELEPAEGDYAASSSARIARTSSSRRWSATRASPSRPRPISCPAATAPAAADPSRSPDSRRPAFVSNTRL